jgi:hypothetical protein
MLALSLKKVVQRYEIIDNTQVVKSIFCRGAKKECKIVFIILKKFTFVRSTN